MLVRKRNKIMRKMKWYREVEEIDREQPINSKDKICSTL